MIALTAETVALAVAFAASALFLAAAFAACAACYGACRWLSPDNTILSLLLRCVIVGVIYPGIWLGVTGRTAEWKQLWGILLRFLPKGKKAA